MTAAFPRIAVSRGTVGVQRREFLLARSGCLTSHSAELDTTPIPKLVTTKGTGIHLVWDGC